MPPFLLIAQPALARDRWQVGSAATEAFQSGDYGAALAALRNELEQCEKAKPRADECVGLLLALSNVAASNGDAEAAEAYARRALKLAEHTLPDGHPDIATSIAHIAMHRSAQMQLAEAEALHRKALALREAALPVGHPSIIQSYHNLGRNLTAQERHAEAEILYRKILLLRKAAHPVEHLGVAQAYDSLALNLNAQRRFGEAEPLLRHALLLHEAELPVGHPYIAMSLHNLAFNLNDQRRYAEAEPLLRRALALQEAVLPAGHQSIALVLHSLAFNLNAQSQYEEAEPLYRRVLAMRSTLNIEDPRRIDASWGMAVFIQQRYPESSATWFFYREAERGALARVRSFAAFDRAAQHEIRKYRPVFTGIIRVAWELSAGR
ncbi:tetratricopeptide repeat protein [Sphingomonas sp. J315]|uniref:tetratricopeptide repeat protein n=1 Tax=Sphingomonas sp. J315 TaxID=2898433 RepID=UPI0021ADE84E|nr:tetratricopeptide repeat protein [Sphingomonas sp. J315]UUX99170.1 tetratricopeptide repeat protein [Sphingomonas sp. J315]